MLACCPRRSVGPSADRGLESRTPTPQIAGSRSLFFDECSEAVQRNIPLPRDAIQVHASVRDRIWREHEPTLPTDTLAGDDARLLEDPEVLGDPLSRQVESARQLGDGARLAVAETRDELEAGRVAEGREHRHGIARRSSRLKTRHEPRCS